MDDPCADPARRQFDFWLGEWEVRDASGRDVGHNRITALFDGCAIREEWQGTSGVRGTSLNSWSPGTNRWHQTWIDSNGDLLLLDGGLIDGSMVLEGLNGGVHHRITWSRVGSDDDQVRQLWQTSPDGTAWQTAFDGRYSRIR
jgi:hypothetical protein